MIPENRFVYEAEVVLMNGTRVTWGPALLGHLQKALALRLIKLGDLIAVTYCVTYPEVVRTPKQPPRMVLAPGVCWPSMDGNVFTLQINRDCWAFSGDGPQRMARALMDLAAAHPHEILSAFRAVDAAIAWCEVHKNERIEYVDEILAGYRHEISELLPEVVRVKLMDKDDADPF